MRSVAMFLGLMGTGIAIVLVYIWSGESLVVLLLSFITLFAVLYVAQWKPWQVEDGPVGPISARASRLIKTGADDDVIDLTDGAESQPDEGQDDFDAAEVWRSRFDITWDDRGVSGVILGGRAPQLWAWSQIDDISRDLCPDQKGGRSSSEGSTADGLAFRLDFPDHRNPEDPQQAHVYFGPHQKPSDVVAAARLAWRESKVKRSRLHDLTLEERTWKMAEHFAGQRLELTESGRSPELLFQEMRKVLLEQSELCRLARSASLDDVMDGFDAMCEAKGLLLLTQDEAEELAGHLDRQRGRSKGRDVLAVLHRPLDWMAEQRRYRLVFLDQGAEDYLIGMVPAASADDWDGQTVGGGATAITLDRPTGRPTPGPVWR